MPTEQHFSAGGVVYDAAGDGLRFVLCGRLEPKGWSLPKGTPDDGETPEQTALREVREETGLDVQIDAPLGDIEYWFANPRAKIHKRVTFYLMSRVGGSTDDHDPEFDVVSWFEAEEALQNLTHANEVAVVRKAMDLITSREQGTDAA